MNNLPTIDPSSVAPILSVLTQVITHVSPFDISQGVTSPITPVPPISKTTSKQSSIDRITMELMMNRSHYKKYLAKQDPHKYQETQEYIAKIKKYRLKITTLMSELFDDSVKSNVSEKYTRDINDTFNEFLKTCVKHYEICELETGQPQDMLFDQNTDSSENLANPSIFVNPHYTMDMYVNKNR